MWKRCCVVVAVCVAVFGLMSCKKEVTVNFDEGYLSAVQRYVRQKVSEGEYESLDFGRSRISKQGSDWYTRIGVKGKNGFSDFLLLKTDSLGAVAVGRLVHLELKGKGSGIFELSSLDRKSTLHSAIVNGYIESFHPLLFEKHSLREESLPVESGALPEVIVVGYLPPNDGNYSFANYLLLQSLFDGSGGSAVGESDGVVSGGGGASGVYSYGGNVGSSGGGFLDAPDITMTMEESWLRPAIDLDAWMKCFVTIPDAGARYSITLCGDLPEEDRPDIGLNIFTGNTGHCFLQLTKSNGGQSITQIIGFTAANAGKAIINADAYAASKIVDNAGHKFNCSITMNLTAFGFSTVIDEIKMSSAMPYSIVNFDCLDFGLAVFNSVRPGNPLVIDKAFNVYDPFSNIANGPKLYAVLQNMVEQGSPETPNISFGGSVHAGESHGPCN